MTSGLLFEGPDLLPTVPPCQRHSDTSREAAEDFAPHLGRGQMAVLRWMDAQAYAVSDNQIIPAMKAQGWSENGPRARRIELARAGLIRDCGRVGKCRVYEVTAAGKAALREAE